MGLFDEIRDACGWVSQRASAVHVVLDRLDQYAACLPLGRIASPTLDPEAHHLGHGEETASFFLVLDTVNFGSGYFPHLHKLPDRSGYFTIASHLADYYRRHGLLSAEELTGLSAADCTALFGQVAGHPVIGELMALFARALNDLGGLLLDRFHGRPVELIEAAGSHAQRLVEILREMPFFEDIESYGGRVIPFFKRAQLLVADLALAFDGKGLGAFRDLDLLTIFADNLVPHVLRVDGLLRYEPALGDRIAREELIGAGSPEEVEIRACALHAVHLLAQRLQASHKAATEQQLDYLLWNRGQSPRYKAIRRHRTRTVFY